MATVLELEILNLGGCRNNSFGQIVRILRVGTIHGVTESLCKRTRPVLSRGMVYVATSALTAFGLRSYM